MLGREPQTRRHHMAILPDRREKLQNRDILQPSAEQLGQRQIQRSTPQQDINRNRPHSHISFPRARGLQLYL